MRKKDITSKITKDDDVEFVRMYYEHHYDRVAKLEEQGLTLTNLVISFSIVGFTFGFNNAQNPTVVAGLVLPITMIIANLFAVAYIQSTSVWIQEHRKCGEAALELHAPNLYKLDKSIFNLSKNKFLGRRRIQYLLHVLLIVVAIFPVFSYLQSINFF